MGWRIPEALIDCASSSSASSLNPFRGWFGFGAKASIGSSSSRPPTSGSAGGGSSAPRPRPSARFIMGEHLLGEFQVRDGAGRAEIVLQDGPAVARRLREADVARDHRPEELAAE